MQHCEIALLVAWTATAALIGPRATAAERRTHTAWAHDGGVSATLERPPLLRLHEILGTGRPATIGIGQGVGTDEEKGETSPPPAAEPEPYDDDPDWPEETQPTDDRGNGPDRHADA